uniref:Si:ch211-215k15.4 n=1 Tax=Poecilia latipinna TaxID=48699 RepID=A0A3B3UDB8_9TELE
VLRSEMKLFSENLSLQGRASQSSLHSVYLPYNAIDGNRGNQLIKGSCSQTSNDFNPWWRLDLRKTPEERLNGTEIRIGDSLDNNGNDNPRCGVITVSPGKSLYEFDCNGMEGRYVNIIIPGRTEYLTLCEVEVYGSTLE